MLASLRIMPTNSSATLWPELPYAAWKDTKETLHLWTQIVGKIRVAQTPWLNHSWHVTFHPSVRGLTTPPIPCGARDLGAEFDFIDHVLWLRASDGQARQLALRPISVAEFYDEVVTALKDLGFDIHIDPTP